MSDCEQCGAKDVGGSHGCLAFDVVMKAHRELQASYNKMVSLLKDMVHVLDYGLAVQPNSAVHREAKKLIGAIGAIEK